MTDNTGRCQHEPVELEVISARLIHAPRERVFEVFRNPGHLVHWWGPAGFTNTFQQFAFHPGGKWRFIMHGTDGAKYPQDKEFMEIIEPCCIVLRHYQHQHNFDMVMTFAEHENGTEVTWRMVFEPSPQNIKLQSFIPTANEENFDRLEAYLKTLPSA